MGDESYKFEQALRDGLPEERRDAVSEGWRGYERALAARLHDIITAQKITDVKVDRVNFTVNLTTGMAFVLIAALLAVWHNLDGQIDNTRAELGDKIDNVSTRLGEGINQVRTNTERNTYVIETVQGQVSGLQDQVNGLQSQVDGLRGDVAALAEVLARIEANQRAMMEAPEASGEP